MEEQKATRFGFEYIKTLFKGCKIIVLNETTNKEDDIMQDLILQVFVLEFMVTEEVKEKQKKL